MVASSVLAASPQPTPRPTDRIKAPITPGGGAAGLVQTVGHPITLPHDGTIIAMALPAAEGQGVGDFGLDQPMHGAVMIADGGHRPGASALVGQFTAGQSLVFYLNTNFGPSYLSTGNHAKIAADSPETWNIGWEDAPDASADFDYDDIVIRVCYGAIIQIGCPPPVDATYGLGGGIHQGSYVAYQQEPVNTATGNYVSVAHDLSYPAPGISLDFQRTYNSLEPAIGRLGVGWTDAYATRLTFDGSGWVTLIGESDEHVRFGPDGAGGLAAVGSRDILSAVPSGYELVRPDQVRYSFNAAGTLQTIRDRNSNALTLGYSAGRLTTLTDPVARVVSLTYDANERLSGLNGPMSLSVTYAYDASGRLATVTDIRGFTTTYGYDAANRLTSIQDQNGHFVVRNTYGSDGRVSDQYDAMNNHTTYAWDLATQTSTMTDARNGTWIDRYASGLLVSRTNPLGQTVRFAFDTSFRLSGEIDARGYEIDTSYDERGNVASHLYYNPLFAVERYTYDGQNNLLTSQDRNGFITTRTYDASGNLSTIRGPGPVSPLTTYTYDLGHPGLIASVTDPRNKTTSFQYDGQGNRIRSASPGGSIATMTYDAAGRILSVVEPRGNVAGGSPTLYTTTRTYDAAGHPLTLTDPLGNVMTYTYDAAGNQLTREDANHHVTRFGYDAADRLTSVTDAANGVTTYTYDAVGNVASVRDAGLHTTTYGHDLAGRMTSALLPLGRTWSYTFDPNGNRLTAVDAIGNSTATAGDGTTTYVHDEWNRITRVTYSDGTPAVTYTYDGNDNRLSLVDGAGTTSYAYDSLNRMTSVTRPGNVSLAYTYDASSNLLSRTPSGGTATTYTYDVDGRLATASVVGAVTTFGYDVAGNQTSVAYPAGNGYLESRNYDRAGRLTEVKNAKGASIVSKATYVLDPAGNRTSLTSTTGTTTYTYDVLDRLTQACFTTACTGSDNFRRYTYDAVGNRLTEVMAAGTTTYNYDLADQLTSTTGQGASTFTYDLDGNQLSAGSSTFTWSLARRMKTSTVTGTTTTYLYDGDGMRRSASTGSQASNTTKFLWDPSGAVPLLAREMDGNNALVREYQYGSDVISMRTGGASYFYHRDGLGSILNVTSAAGATQWTYDYLPFGAQRTATKNANKAPTNVLRFTGEYLDPSGQYHLRARQYDPLRGRFLSLDPVASSRRSPSTSSYVYGRNNPTGIVDPSGGCPMTAAFVILFGGFGTLIGPEGTFGGAALGTVLGGAVCGVETVAELNMASKIIYQTQGKVIPRTQPGPEIVVPFLPGPGPQLDPDTGDQQPTGRGCSSTKCRVFVGVGGTAAIAIGGALLGGTGYAEGEEPYPVLEHEK